MCDLRKKREEHDVQNETYKWNTRSSVNEDTDSPFHCPMMSFKTSTQHQQWTTVRCIWRNISKCPNFLKRLHKEPLISVFGLVFNSYNLLHRWMCVNMCSPHLNKHSITVNPPISSRIKHKEIMLIKEKSEKHTNTLGRNGDVI